MNGQLKRYKVTHKVRPYGSIGIFANAARIIHAANKEAAIDQAREQWHAAKHETMNGDAILTDDPDRVTYLGIQFGPR